MEISSSVKERSTVITAVLTLAIIGLTLMFSAWQTISLLDKAEKQHMEITSKSVLLALESSLRRSSTRIHGDNLPRQAQELFQSLKKEGDVLFAGIVDHRGGRLLTASSDDESITLPLKILDGLYTQGSWSGQINLSDKRVYVIGKEMLPKGYERRLLHESPPTPLYLLIGLDAEEYLGLQKDLKHTSFLQLAYILMAAVLCWILAFSFLSRREKANRADTLERFQAKLLDNLPDGLITLNEDYVIISANPAAIKIIPHEPPLVGKRIEDLHPSLAQALTPILSREYLSEDLVTEIAKGKDNFDLENGQRQTLWQSINYADMHLEVLTLPISIDRPSAYMALIRNRTQLKTLEKNLSEAEKLASIGSLAAGVAHEVRNPLSSLRGFAQYFVKKLAGQDPEEKYARAMVIEADRLNRVVTDLLFLAKPKRIQPVQVDLENLAQGMALLLRFDLEEKKASFESHLEATTIFADEDALKQSLLNLILNSIEAIQEGGKIGIYSREADNGTYISIKDNGPGMDETFKTQAFEPFFTSKARGTGLGLALVNRTCLDHGGRAKISSVLGEGCEVELFFPLEKSMLR